MKKLIILALLILLVFGCSTIKELSHKDKEDLVRANLAYLNKFKSEGVLEVSLKGLSLKKEFVLKKNQNSLRLDVLDSGIFGLLPSPFATLYAKDEIIITNYNKGFFSDLVLDKFPLKEFLDFDKLPQGIINEIVKNRNFSIAVLQFEFDEQYRMNKIIMNKDLISFKYSGKDLIRVELKSTKADVNVDFDRFISGEFPIKALDIKK